MRLESGSAGALPAPSLPGAAVPAIETRADAVAPGMALGQLITAMATRTAVLDAAQLGQRSEGLRTRGLLPESDAFFYTDVHAMNVISHAIEERVVTNQLQCEVYAGFQRFSLVTPQIRRYRALLTTAQYVYLYGLDDAAGTPTEAALHDPRLVRFAIDPKLGTGLEWFWFVVVDDPMLHTALLAQHVHGDIWSPTQRGRQYAGFWTFDAALVGEIVTTLRSAGRILYYGR